MNTSSRRIVAQGSSCDDESEPLNSASSSMRTRVFKRQKLRPVICMMLAGVSVVAVIAVIFMLYVGLTEQGEDLTYDVPGDFLVDGEFCKIPNLTPFSKEAMKVFRREKFEACSKVQPLTSIEILPNGTAQLLIHESAKKEFLSWWQADMTCCYQRIERAGFNASADKEFKLSDCKTFSSPFLLQPQDEFVLVNCKGHKKVLGWKPSSVIYRNAHAVISTKKSVEQKLKSAGKNGISVFLFGIDSISRLNLIRAMPKTYNHLQKDGWFEMRGFNKIADNTFPNLMAMLTGQNDSSIAKTCNWKKVGELENCDFMWSAYSDAGYVTAYAEDEASINTFNYYETGFVDPPTDYYFRPFALGAEKNVAVKKSHGTTVCLGFQSYADHVYQYGIDFAEKFKNDSSFGLFWTNSFSHEDLSMTSAMDDRIQHYLNELKVRGVLDSSVVFFFSDHGMRFGPIRSHFTGWLEERLPFFFVWIPEKVRKAHPKIVENLKMNRDRLSSFYDFHMTLKDILSMSAGKEAAEKLAAVNCPSCQSLFDLLPFNRTCEEAGISKHWCTCSDFKETETTSPSVKKAVKHIIERVNADLSEHPKCAKLKLKQIRSARQSIREKVDEYLVSFDVTPSQAQLEGTVRCKHETCEDMQVVGSVSRLNKYGNQSWCVSDANLRKYCFCT